MNAEQTHIPGSLPGIGGLGPGFEGGDSVVAPAPPAGTHPTAPDAQPLSLRKALTYSSGNFGAGVFYSFNNFILPFYLKTFGASDVLVGILASTRSLEGSIIQPAVGAWSDRIWTRLGRRKPFIVSFVPLCVVFLVLTPFLAPPLATPPKSAGWTLPLILASLGIFLLGMICMAGASTAGIFTHNALLLFIVVTIAGIGNAAQTASSFPLLTRIVFPDQMGLYTGLNTAVTSVAAPLSGFIAGELIDHLGYTAMLPFVAAMFIISLLPLAILRVEKSQAAMSRARQIDQDDSPAA